MFARLAFLLICFLGVSFGQSDFESIFGPRPFGPRDREMVKKQMMWDAQKKWFGEIVDDKIGVEPLVYYSEIGLGLPVVWKRTNGQVFVAFPEARYFKPTYMPLSTVELFPGVVGRTWHLDSVAKGWCVPELNQNFPGSVVSQNKVNCGEK